MRPLQPHDPVQDPQAEVRSVADSLLSPSLLEAVPDAMVAVNQKGVILQINTQTECMFGYTRKELIGQSIEILVPECQRSQHIGHRQQFAEEPRIRRMGVGLNLYGRRRNGSEFPVEISLSPIPTGNGILVLSAIRDITDRKLVEEQLRRAHEELARQRDRELWENRARLALIVDSSQDAIIGKDLNGIITHWNQGAEHIYGYTAAEAIGQPISLLAPQDRVDEVSSILEQVREGQRVEYFESVRVTRDGRRLDMSISVSPIRDANGETIGASTIARNVTGQKRVEEQLRQAQKMEAVGRLAGGIAHDFNNILGIITACTELLIPHVDPEAASSQYIDHIREASTRGASLTRQLLAFSRKQPTKPRVLDLNERLREVSKLLRPLMGDDVEVCLLARSPVPLVEVDPGQLDQIVLNLAVNARDAMPYGGKLIVETAAVNLDDDFVAQHPPMKIGRHVMLAVSDTGTGMDLATQQRIFEPFFTTKETGKGTGLGLSTVYGIVKQSAGHIWVYSEPGHGTTFKIYFPCVDEKVWLGQEAKAETEYPRGEGKTILVVEDDEIMRTLTRKMLEEQGYAVIEASDGKVALEKLASSGHPVDLTLTDVVMRGMSGPDLALRLMNSNPGMKIVYMSGYTDELLDHEGGLTSGITLLEKPFTRSALLGTISGALD